MSVLSQLTTALTSGSVEMAADPNFLIEREHIDAFVAQHGDLPEGGWLLCRTGWSSRVTQQDMINDTETGPTSPGLSSACARLVGSRHEGGAATMTDGYALTGIAEAAKSRTPLVVLAAESTAPLANFYVDQDALARAVGAVPVRITDARYAVEQAVEAVATAVHQRRT